MTSHLRREGGNRRWTQYHSVPLHVRKETAWTQHCNIIVSIVL